MFRSLFCNREILKTPGKESGDLQEPAGVIQQILPKDPPFLFKKRLARSGDVIDSMGFDASRTFDKVSHKVLWDKGNCSGTGSLLGKRGQSLWLQRGGLGPMEAGHTDQLMTDLVTI